MAAEPIATYKKLQHPAYRVSDKSVRTDIEYVGPYDTLRAYLDSTLKRGLTWGDYPGRITDISIVSVANTSPALGELTVSVEYETTPGEGDFGIEEGLASGTVYEIDWTVVSRPLMEHPEFQAGGSNELDEEDRQLLARWEISKEESMYGEMSPAAFYYAEGIDQGIENWNDFAPIAIKTTSYSNGPPPTSSAGAKETPTGFPNLPSGYEWIKSADRSLRSGSRDKWERAEQWMGAKKILVDKNTLYY